MASYHAEAVLLGECVPIGFAAVSQFEVGALVLGDDAGPTGASTSDSGVRGPFHLFID